MDRETKGMRTSEMEAELEKVVGENIGEDVSEELEILDQYGVQWRKGTPWKGFTIYSPYFPGKVPVIGPPLVIMVKDGAARISTPEESLAYLEYAESENAKEKSAGELKAEQTEQL